MYVTCKYYLPHQCSQSPSFITESSKCVLILLGSSHWLYMSASWDRRGLESHKMRPTSPVIDSELNLAHWMSFPTSCVPRLLSPSRQSSLHSITDKTSSRVSFLCGRTGGGHNNRNTCAIWCNPAQHHHKITSSQYQTNTFLTHCQQQLTFYWIAICRCSCYCILHIGSVTPIYVSVLLHKEKKRLLQQYICTLLRKWTLNKELLLLWECKSCEIIQCRYWHL